MYTKITISGRICTGKSTLFKNLSERLHWPTFHTGQFFRDYVKKHGLVLEKAQEQSEQLAKKVDYKVRAMLKIKKGNLILDSWMAGIMADSFPHVLRVLLVCDDVTRIRRFAEREKLSVKDAKQCIIDREKNLLGRLEQIYNRNDFVDPKNYNCVINTTNLTSNQVLARVISCLSF